MDSFNIAILGCGTVGGGVAKIILEINKDLENRASRQINISKIVEIAPKTASEKFNIPIELFCGNGNDLSREEAEKYIQEVISDDSIDLVVETIGGTSDLVYNLAVDVCKSKKHFVTANKALMAERGKGIFDAAQENNVTIGYEAAVCGAIPIIKTIKESISGDSIISVSGIMNGTSNYILSKMANENLDFSTALKLAQENGYAEADPTLDINGGDASHKLIILMKLAFGLDVTMDQLTKQGIEDIEKEDIEFANEIDSTIKLICYAKKQDGKVYATVCPMVVRNSNLLSEVNGATNAVKLVNKFSGKHLLIGAGAGSSETASSIVADIVFAARYSDRIDNETKKESFEFMDAKYFEFPYIITFETEDIPGITGKVTSLIGKQNVNIDTVGHNRRYKESAIFSVATMPCSLGQIEKAIEEMKKSNPSILMSDPKIIPILN